MATFAALKAEIAVDLTRSDLTTQINQAVLDAIADHSVERFWFNEVRNATISLVDATDEYSFSASSTVLEFIHVDWVRVSINSQWVRLERIDPDEMEELHATTTEGEPAWWSFYQEKFRFYPTPNASYTARVAGHVRLVALSADGDTNAWTNAGRALIRYAALKKLFLFPPKDPEKSIGAAMLEQQQLEFLRKETDRRKRKGTMKAYY